MKSALSESNLLIKKILSMLQVLGPILPVCRYDLIEISAVCHHQQDKYLVEYVDGTAALLDLMLAFSLQKLKI